MVVILIWTAGLAYLVTLGLDARHRCNVTQGNFARLDLYEAHREIACQRKPEARSSCACHERSETRNSIVDQMLIEKPKNPCVPYLQWNPITRCVS